MGVTRPRLDTWEKKSIPRGRKDRGHTQLYTPERGGGAGAGQPSRLFVAVLALQSSKASRVEIHLRPITPSFPNRQPFSVTSRKLCQPTSRALELSSSRQKKKTLGCSVSKRQRGAGSQGPMGGGGGMFQGIKGRSSFVEIASDGGRRSWPSLWDEDPQGAEGVVSERQASLQQSGGG